MESKRESYASGGKRESGSSKSKCRISDVSFDDNVRTERASSLCSVGNVHPWRVFISNIDTYHGRVLADLLLEKVYDESAFNAASRSKNEGEEEDEEEEDEKAKENESPGEDDKRLRSLSDSPKKFRVTGTAGDPNYSRRDVKVIPGPEEDKIRFLEEISKCGFIIYDISQDRSKIKELDYVVDELVNMMDEQNADEPQTEQPKIRRILLISNLLTWARKSGEPLVEAKYRKRRPQALTEELLECERRLIRIVRRQPLLSARVLGAAATYGGPQAELHYAFKLAWLVADALPVIGDGDNFLPLVHVRDLATAVFAVMKEWPKSRYVVVAEPKLMTQRQIMKLISKKLGSGKIKFISREEAREDYKDEITRESVDVVTANVNLRSDYLTEQSSSMKWTSSFFGSIDSVLREYLAARNLRPIRVVVLGPPASGKSMIARALADYYQLRYVAVKRLIADTIQQLTNEIEEMQMNEAEEGGVDEDSEEDEIEEDVNSGQSLEEVQGLLDDIRSCLDNNNGKLDDNLLTKLFRRKLLSRGCLNQGYIIDGYPKTYNQAKLLFGSSGSDENEEYEEESIISVASSNDYSNPLTPHVVFALDASDEFLMERMTKLPEREMQKMQYTEQRILSRLKSYRQRNNEDESPLVLFDELEIHPDVVSVEEDNSPQMLLTFLHCQNVIGPMTNYGLTPDEAEEEEKRKNAHAAMEASKLQQEFLKRRREREQKAQNWMELMERLKEEEEVRLCLMAEPLRHYLVKHVFPILTEGLSEVAKLRPDEPIDYLADFLFRTNPEGRPLEPDYSSSLESTIVSIQQLRSEGALPSVGYFEGGIGELATAPDDECVCGKSSASGEAGLPRANCPGLAHSAPAL